MLNEKKMQTAIVLWQVPVMLVLVWSLIEISIKYSLSYSLIDFDIYFDTFAALICLVDFLLLYKLLNISKSNKKLIKYSSFYLFFDLLAIVPIDLILDLVGIEYLFFFPMVRFLKVFKITRILKAYQSVVLRFKFINISIVILFGISFVHIVACLWIILGPPNEHADLSAYVLALYWSITTLTTVGYGDVVPHSDASRLFTMLVMFLGVASYGYVIGTITRTILFAERHREDARQKLQDLALFMEHYEVPWSLQKHVYDYHNYIKGQRLSANDEKLFQICPHHYKVI